MPVKALITKVSAEGEQVGIELSEVSFRDLRKLTREAYDILDDRMYEMNVRLLECNNILEQFEPEERMRFQMVMDVLYGRAKAEHVLLRLHAYNEEKAIENGHL